MKSEKRKITWFYCLSVLLIYCFNHLLLFLTRRTHII